MALRTFLLLLLFAPLAVAHPMRRLFEHAASLDEGTLTHRVYADWLDENGDPARAAFLRNQAEILEMEPGDGRRADLERQGAELLRDHYAAWFPPVPGVVGIDLRAGLVDSVVAISLDYEATIRAAYPSVREVRVLGQRHRLAPQPWAWAPNETLQLEAAMVWLRRRGRRQLDTHGVLRSESAARTCAAILLMISRRH